MGRGRKKTSNKSTPYLNLKGLKTKSYEPENYENINPEDLSDDEIDACKYTTYFIYYFLIILYINYF